ncbi:MULTISPECIES: HAD family hydrolase [Streptomyces]|uniref:HAD family hydrolase n=1 Tax=Streptomyces TaxID=1883 RepID=UPI000998BCA4|nr:MULTISPECIES: HAD hydrolase-like protein [Streptomyces]
MRKAALFDLYGTLTDHAAAFARWAEEFCASTGIPPSALMRAEPCHADARHTFFAEIKSTFKLRRSIAFLHADYRRRSAELVPYRPEVCTALQQLAGHDWELGVVTNGSPDAQRCKLEAARLTRYFRSFVISGDGILAASRVDISDDDREYEAMLEQIRTLGAGLALAREGERPVTPPRTHAAIGRKLTGAAREEFAEKVVAAYRTPGRTVTIHSLLSEVWVTKRGPRPAGTEAQVSS